MKSTVLWSLILLNAVLLASFVWRVMPENRAVAQRVIPTRSGDYIMLPAEINGGASGIMIVLDQMGGQLSAISFDETNQKIETMSKIDVKSIFQAAAAPAAPRAGAITDRFF